MRSPRCVRSRLTRPPRHATRGCCAGSGRSRPGAVGGGGGAGGALVQQANAIESLSNVDVLCLDKTGTLTANKLAVEQGYRLIVGGGDIMFLRTGATASRHNAALRGPPKSRR